MHKYTRNKLITVRREDKDTLIVHGVLDDDIYGIEQNVTISISDLEVLEINGKWNRWTTPECPRAIPVLQEAVGFRVEEEGFSGKVHKIIGRKACRHHANLLLECCYSAKEAAMIAKWEDKKAENKGLTFEDFINGETKDTAPAPVESPVSAGQAFVQRDEIKKKSFNKKEEGGTIIDLHMHSSPASPCSSVPVDQLIYDAKSIGLDGICLTDHNYVWDKDVVDELRQKHQFLILRGNEITTNQGDMLVFGLYKDIQGIIKLEDLRKEVDKVGGFIIVAHPFRGFLVFNVGQLGLTPEKAMERPLFKYVDAVEVLNGKVTEKENSFARKVAEGLGLPVTGGSDAHEVSEVGTYATVFPVSIKDENDLINALKTGNYSPIAFKKERGNIKR